MRVKFFLIVATLCAAAAGSFATPAAAPLAAVASTHAVEAMRPSESMRGSGTLVAFNAAGESHGAARANPRASTDDEGPEPSKHALLWAGLAVVVFIAMRRAADRRQTR